MTRKNPHAVALGSLGGKARADKLSPEKLSQIGKKAGQAGGKARAKALTSKRRSEIASKAAKAMWEKKRALE